MEMTWLVDECGQKQCIRVQLTENSFKKTMDIINMASDDTYIQINDSRFDGGKALFFRKDHIYGWQCPETALLKYQNKEEEE